MSYGQPYPNGGPGQAQPYAQPYQATTQPGRARGYVRPVLIGGAIASAMPTLELFAALSSGAGGLGASTVLGIGIPVILRSFVFGAGIGAGVKAVRQHLRKRAQQQPVAWQGQQPGQQTYHGQQPGQQMYPTQQSGQQMYPMQQPGQQMYPMQQPGTMPAPGYGPPPQPPGGYQQGYPAYAGPPQQGPVRTPQAWPQQGGGPATPQPPMTGRPMGTFGPPHPSYGAPGQHPAAQAPTGAFGPPPAGYGAPARPAQAQAQQASAASSPPVPPQPFDARAGQPAPPAGRAYPNNTAGAQTAEQVLERFAPERRMEVFNQMLQGLRNYPVVRERAPGFANLAQAIPQLSHDARTPSGRVDEQLIAFRKLHAEERNLSNRGAEALHAALREVFGSLTAGAQAAFLRDNKDTDFATPKTV